MTLNRVSMPSPNYSSRGGATVRLIVVHTSEGAQTYQSLGNFFANPSSGVSSHTGIDDASPGVIGEYCARSRKRGRRATPTRTRSKPRLCTPSGATTLVGEWHRHPNMLANCAAWIAEEAQAFGLPITRLTAAQAQGSGRGVCQHIDLGAWGGGHVDCGPGFPLDEVIAQAAAGPPTPAPTPPPPEMPDMIAPPCVFNFDDGSQQVFYVTSGGSLAHHYWSAKRGWTAENLGGSWDPDTGLTAAVSSGGAYQVWGTLANGKRAQCYWTGQRWVTQPL